MGMGDHETMKSKRRAPEQVAGKLAEGDGTLNNGAALSGVSAAASRAQLALDKGGIVHYDQHRCLRTSRRTPSRSRVETSEEVCHFSGTPAATATNDNATTNGVPERHHAQRRCSWSSWALNVSPYTSRRAGH